MKTKPEFSTKFMYKSNWKKNNMGMIFVVVLHSKLLATKTSQK